jgi:hypothetical protein
MQIIIQSSSILFETNRNAENLRQFEQNRCELDKKCLTQKISLGKAKVREETWYFAAHSYFFAFLLASKFD